MSIDLENREKVIKGLEYCIKSEDCRGCIYWEEIGLHEGCPLNSDVLELLKEHEPRVLDWDEIKNYSVVWGEFRGVEDIYPLIVTLDNKGRPLSWNPNINVSDEFLFIVYDEEDRKNTRCWNHEPSDEQRQAVKWE